MARVALRPAFRDAGWVAGLIANVVLLYVAHHLLAWGVPVVTAAWTSVLWAVDLSLYAAIVSYALVLAYHARWLESLMEAVRTACALPAGYLMWRIYPFDFGAMDVMLRWVTLLILAAMVIALVVQVVQFLVHLARAATQTLDER
jgi:hypothetical protein